MTDYKTHILQLIDNHKWDDLHDYIMNQPDVKLIVNKPLINGNNLFHLLCIKGNIEILKKIIENKEQLGLNINLFNNDGFTGQHLYYKYGGNNPIFLYDKEICYINENNLLLITYIVDKIDLLEIAVDRMIHSNCIDNIDVAFNEYIYIQIMEQINKNSTRYLIVLEKLYKKIKPVYLIFIAIELNCIEVIKILILDCFNFNIYSKNKVSVVSSCIINSSIEILIMILEYTKLRYGVNEIFNIINNADMRYDTRPIFMAIHTNIHILELLTDYMKPYIMQYEIINKKTYMFNAIDEKKNTYLHYIFLLKNQNNIPNSIISFFIKHTDLNKTNYMGDTPAHLIFSKHKWIEYKTDLIGRDIDLLKHDANNKNIYQYILSENNDEFIDFTKKIKTSIQCKKPERLFDNSSIKTFLKILPTIQINNIILKDISTQYNFNTTLPYNMIYLKYLEKKYSTLYIPTQQYDKNTIKYDKYIFNMTSYIISHKHHIMVKNLKIYHNFYYSYLPHQIYWIDNDNYYIHPKLTEILKTHNKNIPINTQRYVMLKITIIISVNGSHANTLIYDRLTKTAWHFEPYGLSNISSIYTIDTYLKILLQNIYGSITYNTPTDFLYGLNFQMVDGEDHHSNKNVNDPGGYCAAWSIWFIDIVLAYPDVDIKNIMHNFFNKDDINEIVSDEEGEPIQSNNYYLDFIRRYAHKLDSEKNLILLSNGIKKYNLYNNSLFDDNAKLIKNMFKVK